MRASWLIVPLLVLAGCGGGETASSTDGSAGGGSAPKAKKAKAKAKRAKRAAASGPTTETVSLSDPVKDAFTVDVPKGWGAQAYSSGEFSDHREVVTTTSPDGNTVMFLGDPKIPSYWNPDTANEITVQMAEALDFMELEHFRPAGEYFPQYADEKFGGLDGFEITDFAENTELVADAEEKFAAAGLNVTITAVDVFFRYEQDGEERNGLLIGTSVDGGDFWNVDVAGLSTDGDVADYRPMLEAMGKSKKSNPEYIARRDANHQATMDQIQANTVSMAQGHQQRMAAIAAAGDASTRFYEDRMASMDANQRNFLNYINEEETVAGPGGQNYQVDNAYQRYWMKADGTYVGGDINFDDQKLRAMGLNPDDYQEVQVQR